MRKSGKLVIVPTPIGNLGDITLRALDALRAADVVLAEDTRVTGKLLCALGIEGKRLERLDENLMGERALSTVERIRSGEVVAYCSDAGTPGVSDPGLRLVAAARSSEPPAPVEVLPGSSAAITAYVASGTTAPTFYFGGFFPRKGKARTDLLENLRQLDAALVFYESPNRIASTLTAIASAYPNRNIAVCRELTKLHEEVIRNTVRRVAEDFAARESIKGEIVIVIDPPAADETAPDDASIQTRAAKLFASGTRPKAIAKQLSAEFGIPRNQAYELALSVKQAE